MIQRQFKRSALCWGIALASVSLTSVAQDANQLAAEKEIEEVSVTGSLIPRDGFDEASPMVVFDEVDIKNRGFIDIADMLGSLSQATGATQGEAYTNNFTQNAKALNLRGFGAGRTLVLLNGRRLPENPTPYNGESNFFNFATIPLAAVERVEVLTDGASAIYGSDAIAGVVNVITKNNIEDTTINIMGGTTTEGGGDTQKFQIVTGKSFEKGHITFTAEYEVQDPIYGKDREWLDSVQDNPEGFRYNSRAILLFDNFEGTYLDPGEQACTDSQTDYPYSERVGRGFFCGFDDAGDETIRNYRERTSIYIGGDYELNDNMTLFANATYWRSEAESRNFRLWWGADTLDEDFNYLYHQRIFTPEETGDQEAFYDESTWNITLGLNGNFDIGKKNYNYEVAYTEGGYDYEEGQVRFKEEAIDEWFLGTEDLWGYGILSGNDQHSIYDPLSRDDANQLMGTRIINGDSYSRQATAKVVGELGEFEMFSAPVQFALHAEHSQQGYDLSPDARTLDQTGNGWWGLSGTGGGGDRKRSAIGAELLLPLTDDLEFTLASRYDNYDDASATGGAATNMIKFNWKATDWMRVRGGWGQTFRAPDMHYLFAGESGFFHAGITDYYQCSLDGVNDVDCVVEGEVTSVEGSRQGNIGLEEEAGDNLSFGVVFDPMENLRVSVDWYSIDLQNVVTDQDDRELMKDERDCQLGVLDPSSSICQLVLSQVVRLTDPNLGIENEIQSVGVGPINQATQLQEGVDLQLLYIAETDSWGTFSLKMDYTVITKYEGKEFEDDVLVDYRHDLHTYEPRTNLSYSLGWGYKDFNATLFGHRIGTLPNWAETERMNESYWSYNLNLTYQITEEISFALIGNNILGERPPRDETFDTWPFFYRGQFNAIQREVFAELSVKF